MTTPLGTRVITTRDIDNFPDIYLEAGATGTLENIDSEGAYWVKLDQHFPQLNEWKNAVQIWDYSDENPEYHPENYIKATP